MGYNAMRAQTFNACYYRSGNHKVGVYEMIRMEMTRRVVIGATLAAAPGAVLAAAPLSGSDLSASNVRPPFHFEPVSPSRWRFRSWTWRDDAWRPLTGNVTVEGDALKLDGHPDPQDRLALQAALAEITRDRSGSKAR